MQGCDPLNKDTLVVFVENKGCRLTEWEYVDEELSADRDIEIVHSLISSLDESFLDFVFRVAIDDSEEDRTRGTDDNVRIAPTS